MSNQLKQRQLDNERILVALLRDKRPKAKTKIEQLRADVNDIKLKHLTLVRG